MTMKKLIYSMLAFALVCLTSCNPDGPQVGGGDSQTYVDYSKGKINLVLPSSGTVEADGDGDSSESAGE